MKSDVLHELADYFEFQGEIGIAYRYLCNVEWNETEIESIRTRFAEIKDTTAWVDFMTFFTTEFATKDAWTYVRNVEGERGTPALRTLYQLRRKIEQPVHRVIRELYNNVRDAVQERQLTNASAELPKP